MLLSVPAILLFLSVLLPAVTGHAAVQVFGAENARFTVDVPDGWAVTLMDTGVQLTALDDASSVAMAIRDSDNLAPEKMARRLARATGVRRVGRSDESSYELTGTQDELPVRIRLTPHGEMVTVIIRAGNPKNDEALDRILETMHRVQ